MTREDTKELIRDILQFYPNWKPENLTVTVDAWHKMLKDVSLSEAKTNLKRHVESDKGTFIPNISVFVIKQKEVYGFTGRTYSHDFFEQIEREVEENGGVY